MTTEREKDPDATVKMPLPRMDGDTENFDPEKTLVREDWESVRKDLLRDNQP